MSRAHCSSLTTTPGTAEVQNAAGRPERNGLVRFSTLFALRRKKFRENQLEMETNKDSGAERNIQMQLAYSVLGCLRDNRPSGFYKYPILDCTVFKDAVYLGSISSQILIELA